MKPHVPTKTTSLWLQTYGRVLRPKPSDVTIDDIFPVSEDYVFDPNWLDNIPDYNRMEVIRRKYKNIDNIIDVYDGFLCDVIVNISHGQNFAVSVANSKSRKIIEKFKSEMSAHKLATYLSDQIKMKYVEIDQDNGEILYYDSYGYIGDEIERLREDEYDAGLTQSINYER